MSRSSHTIHTSVHPHAESTYLLDQQLPVRLHLNVNGILTVHCLPAKVNSKVLTVMRKKMAPFPCLEQDLRRDVNFQIPKLLPNFKIIFPHQVTAKWHTQFEDSTKLNQFLYFRCFSSVQDGIYALGKALEICTPPRVSEVSPTSPLKRFQCPSDWRRPPLVISRKIVQRFLFPRLSPPGDRWWGVLGFVPAGSLKLLNIWDLLRS